jgi:hypothetical protein
MQNRYAVDEIGGFVPTDLTGHVRLRAHPIRPSASWHDFPVALSLAKGSERIVSAE